MDYPKLKFLNSLQELSRDELEEYARHEAFLRDSEINDKEPYYFAFDRWFDAKYTVQINDETISLIRYDPRFDIVYQYEGGVYKEISNARLDSYIFEWADYNRIKLSSTQTNFIERRIKSAHRFEGIWDENPDLDNCLNGLVNLETRELLPHTPLYLSNKQIPRTYDPNIDPVIPPLFYKLTSAIPNEDERGNFIKFVINIVHKNHEEEIMMFVYGPAQSGKSTALQIFEYLLGDDNISKTTLHKIGKRFGMSDLYDKRININPDLPIKPLDDDTIAETKKITGNDGNIEIEKKGIHPFKYPIRCFLAFGQNQLSPFSNTAEKEIDSVMRRALLIHFPVPQVRDTKFKQQLKDEKFLDELYSWLVYMRPAKIIEMDIEEWEEINRVKWYENSSPLLTICKTLYEYDSGESEIKVNDIVNEVRDVLNAEGLVVPQQLMNQVSRTLATMKIYRNNQRGINAKYVNIVRKDEMPMKPEGID